MKDGKVRFMVMCFAMIAASGYAATNLYWDISSDPNVQVGDGVWDSVAANWLSGTANVPWTSHTVVDSNDATFNAGNGSLYTVTLGEDVYVNKITFVPDANCVLAGEPNLILNTWIFSQTPTATINCDIDRNKAAAGLDPEVRVNGYDDGEATDEDNNNRLIINGDIVMTEAGSFTEDIVFARDGYRSYVHSGDPNVPSVLPDPVTIIMNGNVYNNSTDGVVNVRGWLRKTDATFKLAPVKVLLNGTIQDGGEFRLHTGGILIIGGRLDVKYINMYAKAEVNYYNDMPPVLKGADDGQGVLAFKTAEFGLGIGLKPFYIKNSGINSTSNGGGKIYANNLNLEVDADGLDLSGTDEFKLVDHQAAVGGRWYGSLKSAYVVNAPSAILTMINMPPTGSSTTNDIFFALETADLDSSGCVDIVDLAELAGEWLSPCYGTFAGVSFPDDNDWCGGADLNHSGTVDLGDLSLFSGKWRVGCN